MEPHRKPTKTAPPVPIAVFGRIPRPGAVKTRLAAEVGPARAAGLYAAFLGDTLDLARAAVATDTDAATGKPAGTVWLCLAPDRELDPLVRLQFEASLPTGIRVRDQHGADLGARMAEALEAVAAAGRGPAMVLGSDAPDLPVELIRTAAGWLARGEADVALTPTPDGGYALVGTRDPTTASGLFAGVEWSVARTCEQTLSRAGVLGLAVRETAPWQDVDTAADLSALIVRLVAARNAGGPLPIRTAALLLSP